MVKLFRTLSRGAKYIVKKTKGKVKSKEVPVEVVEWQPAANLDQISTMIHNGCMGLPQELIDHIMDILHNNLPALKACSLTCRAIFASTRRLIHNTLRLTPRSYHIMLTVDKMVERCYRESTGDDVGANLRFLSHMGERGLLQYTRQVYITAMYDSFTPGALLPHLHHFQSLDRVHTLTINHYDVVSWANHWKTCFIHFYPSLTSLTLRHPFGNYLLLLQFSLQFPNLQNLCIELLRNGREFVPGLTIPTAIDQSPPLRGHLRLAGVVTVDRLLVDSARKLSNGFNFRSVELEDFWGSRGQRVLNACADTVENLTIIPDTTRYRQLSLNFTKLTALRRLTLRMTIPQVFFLDTDSLLGALCTITSLTFCEFVLELDKHLPGFNVLSSRNWERWEKIDEFLEERFSGREGFRLIIRTSQGSDIEAFQEHAQQKISLLTRKGCFHFETPYPVAREHWD